jgi:hypothetical protein
MARADGVKTNQIAREVEASDLLVALFGDGVALNRTGADCVK